MPVRNWGSSVRAGVVSDPVTAVCSPAGPTRPGAILFSRDRWHKGAQKDGGNRLPPGGASVCVCAGGSPNLGGPPALPQHSPAAILFTGGCHGDGGPLRLAQPWGRGGRGSTGTTNPSMHRSVSPRQRPVLCGDPFASAEPAPGAGISREGEAGPAAPQTCPSAGAGAALPSLSHLRTPSARSRAVRHSPARGTARGTRSGPPSRCLGRCVLTARWFGLAGALNSIQRLPPPRVQPSVSRPPPPCCSRELSRAVWREPAHFSIVDGMLALPETRFDVFMKCKNQLNWVNLCSRGAFPSAL